MEHEEVLRRLVALEMRVTMLERRDPAVSRGNGQEECGIQSHVKEERVQLPERCWELLELAKDGGLLGEDWRPKISKRKCGMLANIISTEVWGKRRWKPFEELWDIDNLSRYYCDVNYNKNFNEIEAMLLQILQLQ